MRIHVDAASGGFVAPFIYPDLKWDFRLENVSLRPLCHTSPQAHLASTSRNTSTGSSAASASTIYRSDKHPQTR